jgi:transposase
MAVIPTLVEEDAKRPHRERETLIGEQTTIINRIKATLTRLGIRKFNPKLKRASERLEHLCTPEGETIPPNTLAELHRDMERRRLVAEQIRQIEKARLERLEQAPKWTESHGPPSNPRDRDWYRDRGHAGAGDLVTKLARPARCGALQGPDRFA